MSAGRILSPDPDASMPALTAEPNASSLAPLHVVAPATQKVRNRVLVVAPQPFYEDRGTPIAVRQFVEALTHLGHDVDIVTYPIGETVDIPGVRYFRAANPLRLRHVPIGFSLRKLVLDATLVLELRRRLSRERYDFVHAVEEAAFPAAWLGRRRGIPVVYDMQSSLPEQLMSWHIFRPRIVQRLLRAMERWVLRRADLVISSAGLAAQVRRMMPEAHVREWKFSSAMTSVNGDEVPRLRASLGIPEGAPVVLYGGTFATYQGLFELMRAIPTVCAAVPGTVFVFVGAEGRAGDEVRSRSQMLGLNGAVRLVERQARWRMPAFYALADVLVSPRRHGDNLPLKIFDYLAAGRPIVATDIATHRSVLDERLAVLVAPRAEELARGVVSLLRDREQARMLGDAAAAYAAENLGWLTFVDSVQDLSRVVTGRD